MRDSIQSITEYRTVAARIMAKERAGRERFMIAAASFGLRTSAYPNPLLASSSIEPSGQ